MMLDHDEVRNERQKLNLSQAAVARATGLNRTVLSSFETGQTVLTGKWAEKLAAFFEEHGVQLTDVADDSSAPASRNEGRLRCRDNFVLAPGLDEERVEELLEEIHELEDWIAELEEDDWETGMFGPSEASQKKQKLLLLLYAKWRCLVLALQGRETVAEVEEGEEPSSQGERLGQQLQEAEEELLETT